MFKSSSLPYLNDQQRIMHRAWLEETLSEHQEKVKKEKEAYVNDRKMENERLKKQAEEEKTFKEYAKDNKQRQFDIMKQVNQAMIDQHETSKTKYKQEKRDPWGDNYFFEKMWSEKGVLQNDLETLPNHSE
jgi:hypothetical protein